MLLLGPLNEVMKMAGSGSRVKTCESYCISNCRNYPDNKVNLSIKSSSDLHHVEIKLKLICRVLRKSTSSPMFLRKAWESFQQ